MGIKKKAEIDAKLYINLLCIAITALFAVVGYGLTNINTLNNIEITVGGVIILSLLVAIIELIKAFIGARKLL